MLLREVAEKEFTVARERLTIRKSEYTEASVALFLRVTTY